ncbi:MAG TPA: Sec-independent protein translocase subunit TatA [Pseudonocardiaceae bacterium]
MPSLGPWELLLILAVLVLLFGAKKLPDSARAIGRSLRIFKAETKGLREDDTSTGQAAPAAQPDAAQPQQLPPASPQVAPQTGAKVTEPAEQTQARNDGKH